MVVLTAENMKIMSTMWNSKNIPILELSEQTSRFPIIQFSLQTSFPCRPDLKLDAKEDFRSNQWSFSLFLYLAKVQTVSVNNFGHNSSSYLQIIAPGSVFLFVLQVMAKLRRTRRCFPRCFPSTSGLRMSCCGLCIPCYPRDFLTWKLLRNIWKQPCNPDDVEDNQV